MAGDYLFDKGEVERRLYGLLIYRSLVKGLQKKKKKHATHMSNGLSRRSSLTNVFLLVRTQVILTNSGQAQGVHLVIFVRVRSDGYPWLAYV